ncbi:MAG: MBL fold metallo-hydrolase [Chloroflexi bacterium]|nr:MBL fold metallo-hydrolase [Chloroflexota bacterium]MDA1296370.1 MBL fold metallo-hydrolase [Chloroflexota bacterium]
MEIRSLGRSGFEVKSAVGTVLIDPPDNALQGPFSDPNTIIAFSKRIELRRRTPVGVAKLIEGPGEYEIGGVSIRGVATPADEPSMSHEINTAYVIDADGVLVCSTGGLGNPPDTTSMQQLGKVNVLLLDPEQSPMSGDELAAIVRNFEPDMVIPSGYDTSAGKPGALLGGLLAELGVKNLEAQPRITLSKSSLPETRTTVLLAPQA